MAVAKLILTDTNLTDQNFKIDLQVEGAPEHGMTSAHLTAAFIMTQIVNPHFMNNAAQFADLCHTGGFDQPPVKEATITVILTDHDLEKGSFTDEIEFENPNVYPHQGSAAQTTAVYIIAALRDPAFQQRVWDFARELVAKNGGVALANDNIAADAA